MESWTIKSRVYSIEPSPFPSKIPNSFQVMKILRIEKKGFPKTYFGTPQAKFGTASVITSAKMTI